MAPVIWGLDLSEMQWGKFKGSYMFNRVYHLRRAKMIVYQIAMTFCVISESVGTAALSDYVDQEDGITSRFPAAGEYNNDFVGIMGYNIFVGVSIATVFGAAFFFDLFWPERRESRGVKRAWRVCAVAACVLAFADAIAMTVIVATREAHISGTDAAGTARIIHSNPVPTLVYRENPYAVTSVVFLWIGMVATIASTYILFKSYAHNEKFGPKAAHTRKAEGLDHDIEKPEVFPAQTTDGASAGPDGLPAHSGNTVSMPDYPQSVVQPESTRGGYHP